MWGDDLIHMYYKTITRKRLVNISSSSRLYSCFGGGENILSLIIHSATLYNTVLFTIVTLCVSHWAVSDFLQPHVTVTHQVPLSVEFSRQEYWSGLPFPTSGNLPDPGIEPGSPVLQMDSLSLSHRKSL